MAILSVIYTECHYAECHYTECHFAECRGAVSPGGTTFTTTFKNGLNISPVRERNEESWSNVSTLEDAVLWHTLNM